MREIWLPGSSISGHSARYALTPTQPRPITLADNALWTPQADKVAGAKACAILKAVSPPTPPISIWVRKPDISFLVSVDLFNFLESNTPLHTISNHWRNCTDVQPTVLRRIRFTR